MKANSFLKYFYVLLFSSLFTLKGFSQTDKVENLFKKVTKVVKQDAPNSLSSDEISKGLKEALIIGAESGTKKLSSPDGFFKDAMVKILLPQEIQNVEKKMRFLGMGKLFDDAVLSLNRAAEEASKSAAPIFIDAIKKMTVKDALQILKGSDTSATGYLRNTTQSELINSFKPIIDQSLKNTDATKYWTEIITATNKFSLKKTDPDLTNYVTMKALDGIFYHIGQEEKNIRNNPEERVTEILKKVFQ